MLFNSLQFALFFPTVTAAYFLCPRHLRWILLLVASYAFYMAWRWEYGVLLATMSAVDWYVALRIERATNASRKRLWLLVTVLGNFGMLCVFKYFNLFNATAAEAAGAVGLHWPIPLLSIFLPVGISFHTFQTVGYAVDVYRGALAAERNPLRFALFVSFFPQLVAGPIERATNLLPQLQRPTDFDHPYGSRSISEIWSRWHISLSTWFRDYLYFPLGGNRVSFARWSFNVTLVFLVSGIWHGAEWRFALWGLMHGALLVLDRVTLPLRDRVAAALGLEWTGLRAPIATALTLVLWTLTLVPFRAESMADAAYVYAHLPSGWSRLGELEALGWFLDRVHLDPAMFALCLAFLPLVYAVDAARRRAAWVEWMRARPTAARWAVDYVVLFAILFMGHWADMPFVYFQF